jgi:RNA-directed DNA polymerase
MRLEERNIDDIRKAFCQMQTKNDLLQLLNYAKTFVYGEKTIPFELRQLTWYADPKNGGNRYTSFTIKKKSGSERTIHAPNKGLKAIQRSLALILQCVFRPHEAAMGFVKKRSILDNARIHEGSRYVYNIDLRDFFPSIDQARVWACLKLPPFDLGSSGKAKKRNEPRLILAGIIASLCCTSLTVEREGASGNWVFLEMNVLPQGAPTSPVLSNVVCQRLDFLLTGVAKRFKLKYSRYADDITFSSMHNVFEEEGDFVKELRRVVENQHFHIKEEKTRLQEWSSRQEVTGLVVNEKANVRRQFVKDIRMWLNYWERYGFARTSAFFRKKYLMEQGAGNKDPDMIAVLSGKLDYLHMIRGETDERYLSLVHRFNSLVVSHKGTGIAPAAKRKVRLRIPSIHYPQQLVGHLKNFSKNDKPLKFTTHSWDEGRDARMFKDLGSFLQSAKQQYKGFSYELASLSKNLNGKLYGFLFNDEVSKRGWGILGIKFGWSSPELLTACTNNPGLNPEDFMLPAPYQCIIGGKTIQKFRQVIEVFKNEIEVRDDNSVLQQLILEKHTRLLTGFADPILNNLDNKTFYTDVQWISSGLELMFKEIGKRPRYPEVSYSVVQEKKDTYTLEILHKGSFNTGKSMRDEKLSLRTGDFGEIQKYLRNLCDWSIESRFEEGHYRINYLTSDPVVPPYEEIQKADGFKHRLTFYK